MECLFCNFAENGDFVYHTKNFYIKVGLGIISAGHCMIISKKHYKCMAQIDASQINEYLDLKNKLIEFISQHFHKPVVIEHGVFAQSVFHAHVHFIPLKDENYNVDLIKEMVLPIIKEFNLEYKTTHNFLDIQEFYTKNKEYLLFEQDGLAYIIKTNNTNSEIIKKNLIYRKFFASKGVQGVKDWKLLAEEEKVVDETKRQKTINILKTYYQ